MSSTFRALVLLAAGAALGAAPTIAAQRSRPPRCAGGYWTIDGGPLVAGGSTPDALVIGPAGVSTTSGCPATRPRVFKGSGAGDALIVRWSTCGGSTASATLKARFGADCTEIKGTYKTKGAKGRSFTAKVGLPEALRIPWDGETLPDGAVLVSPTEFLDAAGEPGFRIVTPTQQTDDEAASAAAAAADDATIDGFVAAHPDRADFVSTAVDPADPTLQATDDGNYLLAIWDADGEGHYVITQGSREQRAVIADTIRTFPTQANQLMVYRELYAFAHAHLDSTLPAPDDVVDETVDQLSARNRRIASHVSQAEAGAPLPPESLPENFPSRCSNEIGSGDGTDGSAYCSHTSGGLWRTASWPLKYFATCTKSQGARGSCVAFATTAGRELRVAQQYGRWVNLSEQHLYYTAKRTLQPAEFGDGLGTSALQDQLQATRYEQPLEEAWDYNPSYQRVVDKEEKKYTNSCAGYVGAERSFCSDTVHQGSRAVCMKQGTQTVCAVTAPPLGPTRVRGVDQPGELWDPTDPINALGNLIFTLLNQNPVVLAVTLTDGVGAPNSEGFVRYQQKRPKLCRQIAIDPNVPDVLGCEQTADCECPQGGHALLAVGYIPQSKLPPGTPESTGGFLIVKNSWGCSGDGGYYYIPAAWARSFIRSARPVGQVEVLGPLPDQPQDNFKFDYRPARPEIEIVQPKWEEQYVAGQGIPMTVEGADFQNPQWELTGSSIQWTADPGGDLGTGQSIVATLSEGVHRVSATYTGTLGAVVRVSVYVDVQAPPPDLPPTPIFTSYVDVGKDQCPGACGPGADTCIVGFGSGQDPEDGALTDGAHVRWYFQVGDGPLQLGSTGASSGNQGKFIRCFRKCGATFRYVLEVEDSQGNKSTARRVVFAPDCVN